MFYFQIFMSDKIDMVISVALLPVCLLYTSAGFSNTKPGIIGYLDWKYCGWVLFLKIRKQSFIDVYKRQVLHLAHPVHTSYL